MFLYHFILVKPVPGIDLGTSAFQIFIGVHVIYTISPLADWRIADSCV